MNRYPDINRLKDCYKEAIVQAGGNIPADKDSRADDYFKNIVIHYLSLDRHYHTLNHINSMINLYSHVFALQYGQIESIPADIALSVFYHDLVYDVCNPAENELFSIHVMKDDLKDFNVSQNVIDKIEHNINLSMLKTDERNTFTDLDLSILSAPEKQYDEYAKNIRLEYSFVPENIYCQERAKILEKLASTTIYSPFYSFNEQHAKDNLAREIANLKKGIIL